MCFQESLKHFSLLFHQRFHMMMGNSSSDWPSFFSFFLLLLFFLCPSLPSVPLIFRKLNQREMFADVCWLVDLRFYKRVHKKQWKQAYFNEFDLFPVDLFGLNLHGNTCLQRSPVPAQWSEFNILQILFCYLASTMSMNTWQTWPQQRWVNYYMRS